MNGLRLTAVLVGSVALRPLRSGPSEWMILSLALRRVAEGAAQLPGVANATALASLLSALSTTLKPPAG
jgi:hypothetical protein